MGTVRKKKRRLALSLREILLADNREEIPIQIDEARGEGISRLSGAWRMFGGWENRAIRIRLYLGGDFHGKGRDLLPRILWAGHLSGMKWLGSRVAEVFRLPSSRGSRDREF